MDNANTKPSDAPATEATNTTSSTPASSTPTSSTQVAPSKPANKKKTIGTIIGVVAIIVALILVNVISKSVSKHNAEKHLNETIEVCDDKGYYSDECKEMRDKYGVTCNILSGDCTIEYKYTLFF